MSLPILGIDIAKDKYVVTLLHNGQRRQREFTNRPVEFKRLQAWLNKQGAPKVHACMEATGRYGEALAQYLHTLHLRAGASVTRGISSVWSTRCGSRPTPRPG